MLAIKTSYTLQTEANSGAGDPADTSFAIFSGKNINIKT